MFPEGAHIVVRGIIEAAEEGGFVAFAPDLEVASQGETIEEAGDNLGEAIVEFIDALEEFGTLEAFLQEHDVPVHYERPAAIDKVANVTVEPGVFVSAFRALIGGGRALTA